MSNKQPKYPDWFDYFLQHHFWHLQVKVSAIMWLTLTILGVLIGTLVVRFLID